MRVQVDRHSRRVGFLKVVLPLAALAVLSTLFLFSRGIDTSGTVPFSDVDVADMSRDPRISTPDYTGVTEDGTEMNIVADTARPGGEAAGRLTAVGPRAVLLTPDGARTEIAARDGVIDETAGTLLLQGDVVVTTSAGYVVNALALTTALDRTFLQSDGPVAGIGPLGRLTAGQMRIEAAPGRPGAYVMVFTGGVNLIYRPDR